MLVASVLPGGLVRSDDLAKPLRVITEPRVDHEVLFGEAEGSQIIIQSKGSWFQYDSEGNRLVRCEVTSPEFITLSASNNVVVCRYVYSKNNPNVRILAIPWDSVEINDFVLCQGLFRGTTRVAILKYLQYMNGLRTLTQVNGPALKIGGILEDSERLITLNLATTAASYTIVSTLNQQVSTIKIPSRDISASKLLKDTLYLVCLDNTSTTNPSDYIIKVLPYHDVESQSWAKMSKGIFPTIPLLIMSFPSSNTVVFPFLKYEGLTLTQERWQNFKNVLVVNDFQKDSSRYGLGLPNIWDESIGNLTGYPKGAELVYYQDGDVTKRRTVISMKDNNKDNFSTDPSFIGTSWFVLNGYPIKSIYTQYPSGVTNLFDETEEPAILFGGDWELQFNTGSFFFRTEGSNSSENRTNGIQGDCIRNITGGIQEVYGFIGSATGGVFTDTPIVNLGLTLGYQEIIRKGIQFNASNVVPTGSENRPINILKRIWKRVR